MQDSEVVSLIEEFVAADLPKVPPFERDWLETHLARPPRPASFSLNDDGSGSVCLWLVTEHTGIQDASTRIVFDPERRMFGLVMDLRDDIEWYMGLYAGGFADVLNAM